MKIRRESSTCKSYIVPTRYGEAKILKNKAASTAATHQKKDQFYDAGCSLTQWNAINGTLKISEC